MNHYASSAHNKRIPDYRYTSVYTVQYTLHILLWKYMLFAFAMDVSIEQRAVQVLLISTVVLFASCRLINEDQLPICNRCSSTFVTVVRNYYTLLCLGRTRLPVAQTLNKPKWYTEIPAHPDSAPWKANEHNLISFLECEHIIIC